MGETISFVKFTKSKDIGNDEGKNSNVFLAIDDQLGDELVIKQMDKAKFNPGEYFSEAKMLYDNKHPNIVEIQYASQDDKNIYLAMPYYANGSLNSVAEKRFLTVREIIKYSLDLLSAVSYIHSKGLLHLDIKPTNILIDESGKAVLTDFGLSRYMDHNGIAEQLISYLPHSDPEFYLHNGRTVQSDIYQVGLTMYRLCNGVDVLMEQLSTKGISNKDQLKASIKKGEFPDRKAFLPHIPSSLKKVVLKAIEVNPSKRYNNTIEMMNDLSVIDDNLDWVYTGKPGELLTKIVGPYKFVISLVSNKSIESYKINLDTKKKNKISKYCFNCINQSEIDKNISVAIGGLN